MTFPAANYARRRDQVRKLLRSRNLDAFLVTAEKNVSWLTGFTGDSTWLVITADSDCLLSDSRFATQIEEECAGVPARIRDASMKMLELLQECLSAFQPERCGFEGHSLTFETAQALQSLPIVDQWTPVNWEIEQFRSVKDREEIAEIREAVRIAERGLAFFKSILSPDLTEQELSAELEHGLRRFGATGCSFPSIIGVGDRAALPHYRPGDRKISEAPFVLLDWGARLPSGYCSDLTRTMWTGKTPAGKGDRTFEKVYKTVLHAQLSAISLIAPGISCREVDAAARQVIQKAGYGQYFGHGLGHGIGLDVHELPRFSQLSDAVLKPGMVVTVEPGIYLPGWGGVRIEDDVLVTRNGCEVLSSCPKGWDSVTVNC